MSTIVKDERLDVSADLGRHSVDLRQGAVLIFPPLDQEHRTRDIRECRLDVPRNEVGIVPYVAPSGHRRERIAVIFGHAINDIGSFDTGTEFGDLCQPHRFGEHMWSEQHETRHWISRGVKKRNRGPVGMTDEDRINYIGSLDDLGKDIGLVIHEIDRAIRLHVRPTMPVSAVHHRPLPYSFDHVCGKRSPQLDRTEALVEEHERRCRGTITDHTDIEQMPVDANQVGVK